MTIGKTPPLAVIVQLHCAMCKKKASATCSGSGCGNVSICANGKRTCNIDHCNGECTKKKAARATFDLCCVSLAFRFILDLGIALAREFP